LSCADPAAERRDHIVVVSFIGFHGELLALADLGFAEFASNAHAIKRIRCFVLVASINLRRRRRAPPMLSGDNSS
jgi:hypothetical protein